MFRVPVITCGLLLIGSPATSADDINQPAAWEYDRIELNNGSTLTGLWQGRSAEGEHFRMVTRKPGRPTVCLDTVIKRHEIKALDLLSAEQRQQLRQRLEELKRYGDQAQLRSETLELAKVSWGGQVGAGYAYDSDYFRLISNAPEAVVRRTAVRLEQIYAAYARFLPPRYPGGKPTTIMLVNTEGEYKALIRREGKQFDNPAFFEPDTNRVVCFFEHTQLVDEIEQVHQENLHIWQELDAHEKTICELYSHPRDRQRFLQPFASHRQKLIKVEQLNNALIDQRTEKLFAMLYHEAFHAYLLNYVYPYAFAQQYGTLPTWFNEGLAQLFESSFVEAGELRIGHAERKKLEKVRDQLRNEELLPLHRLLTSAHTVFQIVHRGDQVRSNQAYLTSWALAYYLTFELRLLGSKALDDYTLALQQGQDSVAAFEQMVGESLDSFEPRWHAYLRRLQSDGRLRRP